MERYVVRCTDVDAKNVVQLVIPFEKDQPVSAFFEKVKSRYAKHSASSLNHTLRLSSIDGPILDDEDALKHVILDPAKDIILAVHESSSAPQVGQASNGQDAKSSEPAVREAHTPPATAANGIKIRIITPALAKTFPDISTIPLLQGGVFIPLGISLWDLKTKIANSLGHTLDNVYPSMEFQPCNCTLVKYMLKRGILRSLDHFLVAFDDHKIERLPLSAPTRDSIFQSLRERFGAGVESTYWITLENGTLDSEQHYIMLPTVVLCSNEKHTGKIDKHNEKGRPVANPGQEQSHEQNAKQELTIENDEYDLDLHLAEAPIEILSPDLTLENAKLNECTVNGVLNLYVVERRGLRKLPSTSVGKEAIFSIAPCWQISPEQSSRGMAAFLSSLRVFTHLINAAALEEKDQDEVLGQIFNLTHFPPAMLAIYVLMQGNTPRASQCAALIQALLEVLRTMIPLHLIGGDESRFLEGSRLLFGFILAKAKQQANVNKKSSLIYIDSVTTIDLLNPETLRPILHPVSTSMGLLEESFFHALHTPGLFENPSEEPPTKSTVADCRPHRLALITGGQVPEVCALNIDHLIAHLHRESTYETAPKQLHAHAYRSYLNGNGHNSIWDLTNLAGLSEANGLAVVAPSDLARTKSPMLSLDKEAYLSVYLGKVPCGDPTKDTILFRPLHGEDHVDVAIITQIISPILEARLKDGTFIFESAGGSSKRNARDPEEIIVFTVDCSYSMRQPSDFLEMQHVDSDIDEDEDSSSKEDSTDDENYDVDLRSISESPRGNTSLSFTQLKDIFTQHESFSDIVAIIQFAGSLRARGYASRIIKHLITLYTRERDYRKKQITTLRSWATSRLLQGNYNQIQYARCKRIVASIVEHEQGIIDYLMYRADTTDMDRSKWVWTPRDEIPLPKAPHTMLKDEGSDSLALSVPQNFVCPISQEVFDDPVFAADGVTYDRKAIQRWFQLRKFSPSTNLALNDISLRSNGSLANEIKTWVNGENIGTTPFPESKKRSFATRNSHLNLRFDGLARFARRVPKTSSIADLYHFAFQGMRGKYSHFELRHKDDLLRPSENTIGSEGLNTMSRLVILRSESVASSTSKEPQIAKPIAADQALIKVYRHYKHLFSYWLPRRNSLTFTSLIFRHWRYLVEHGKSLEVDVDIWTDMYYSGDGGCCGFPNDHWTAMMSSAISGPMHGTGILSDESLYLKPGEVRIETKLDLANRDILVLKMHLEDHGYQARMRRQQRRDARAMSRLDTSKYIFDNLVNRSLAYDLNTHIGLVTFSTSPLLAQNVTHALEDFRSSSNKMKSNGDTAVWDALALACHHLSDYAERFPNALRRIVCLSDGLDTCSKKQVHDVCQELMNNNIVVDSFCIGDEDNVALRTVSWFTGGYKFIPKSLDAAMAISEMEPVLNQNDRVSRPSNVLTKPLTQLNFTNASINAKADVVNRDVFPQRKQHPSLQDSFIAISEMSRGKIPAMTDMASTIPAESGSRPMVNDRPARRLLAEIQSISANPHPHYDVFVSESDIGFWKISMQGPPDSSYESGVFLLYLHMEAQYPAFPPKARFCTPILHPNINRHGRICHSILDRNWTADTSQLMILNTIYSLLLTPEFSDPVNSIVIQNYHWDQVAFQDEVREHIKRHASESRESMRQKILGE